MLSDDPYQKAMMRIWMSYSNKEFLTFFYDLLTNQDRNRDAPLRDALTQALYFIEHKGFNHASGKGPFFFGKMISLVDLSFYPFLERFVINEYYRDAKIPQDCKRLRQWIRTLQQRPSVIKKGRLGRIAQSVGD